MSNESRAKQLETQIIKRLEVLQSWASNGVPSGCVIPTSLTKVRQWQDDILGIKPIGSPKSFLTSNKTHGANITRISKLLKKLNAPQPKAKRTPIKLRLCKEREKVSQYKEALTNAANQYVQLKIQLEETQRKLRLAQQSQNNLEADLKEAGQNNKILEAKLAVQDENYCTSKVTSIYSRDCQHEE